MPKRQNEGDVFIPPEFFATLNEAEQQSMMTLCYLDEDLCKKLWRFTDRQGTPPTRLDLYLSEEDVSKVRAALFKKLGIGRD